MCEGETAWANEPDWVGYSRGSCFRLLALGVTLYLLCFSIKLHHRFVALGRFIFRVKKRLLVMVLGVCP